MRSSTPHQAWGQDWPPEWDPGLGPDLPEDGSGFEIGHWEYRWPVGCSRPTELIGGVLVFFSGLLAETGGRVDLSVDS